jgi:tagatose-6-phosphate ketose/aldose isomerase
MDLGTLTHAEIFQQPELWPDTVGRVRAAGISGIEAPLVTGAGSSAYAAAAVSAAWPGSLDVPSTALLLEPERHRREAVISLARSGDSPESLAVVDRLPRARHIAITCNAEGRLAARAGVQTILLDPRTNDRGLAMTSSFSNLVMAGIALARPQEAEAALPALCAGWENVFACLEEKASALASRQPSRAVALASPPLFGAAREASLKILEMTGGRVAAIAETYLGLRHGPMSFLESGTLVLCFLSSDPALRRYETDLVAELREKGIGIPVGLGRPDEPGVFDTVVETGASALADCLRTPAEIVFPQLLAWHLSVRNGLDPDNPSPGGVINRVVRGVRIYG